MFRHILPNYIANIGISTVRVANVMSETALSFWLRSGRKPSLGALISIGFNYIFSGVVDYYF